MKSEIVNTLTKRQSPRVGKEGIRNPVPRSMA